LTYQEEVDDAEAPLPNVDLLLRAEVIGDVGEVAADQRERDDKSVLSRKLQTHLKEIVGLSYRKLNENESKASKNTDQYEN